MTADFQLGAGESITWSGRSNSERLLIRSDYLFVLSGAVLGVLALGAFIASILAIFAGDGAAAFVGLVISMAVGALALFLMFGRLIRRYRRAHRTSYAITNTRVIEVVAPAEHSGEPTVRSVLLADQPKAAFTDHFERRGSITVGTIKLENIDNAAVVYELLSAELAKLARA
ncbi:MAG: hypothetical protein JHC98_10710 [Thermoleophilaceae bacterium]|nr:hypothetical protein [Thermoleophilaceae bacterium]